MERTLGHDPQLAGSGSWRGRRADARVSTCIETARPLRAAVGLLHLSCADVMRFNYPAGITNPLEIEMPFDAGAADALLHFGTDVVAFEFKGSLLTHAGKAERNFAEFEKDFRKKFGEKDNGERKGISRRAIREFKETIREADAKRWPFRRSLSTEPETTLRR